MSKVVVFRTGNEEYGIPLQYVVSIEKVQGITQVPQMPDYVKGMIEIREQLIPVIDLEYIFFKCFLQSEENTRIIVIQAGDLPIGILVNEAKEIIEIAPEKIRQINLLVNPKTSYISGVASIDGRLVTIMKPEGLIHSLDRINELQEYLESHL